MRIIEVVVLESLRQGYDYSGKIVWVTGMSKDDVEDALLRLDMKGLVIRREKRGLIGKDEYYELAKGLSEKIGEVKRSGLLNSKKEYSAPLQEIKDIWGSRRIGATATTTINRRDFNIVYNRMLEAGGAVVGDQVSITLDMELTRNQ